MSVDPARYRPPQASERLLPKHPQHGYTGCRLSAAWVGAAVATLGESTLTPEGRPMSPSAIRRDLERMLKGTGDPDRAGYRQDHVPGMLAAIDLPAPERLTGDFDDMWADRDAAYTIAGNPQDIRGASTLEHLAAQRSWSGVNHELLLMPHRGDFGTIFDPMRPQGGSYAGDRVPKAELRQFMRSPELQAGGKPIAERFPVGGWTQAALQTRKLLRRLAAVTDDAHDTAKRLRARIAELEAGDDVDCSLPVAAALDGERVAIRDLVEVRRSE